MNAASLYASVPATGCGEIRQAPLDRSAKAELGRSSFITHQTVITHRTDHQPKQRQVCRTIA